MFQSKKQGVVDLVSTTEPLIERQLHDHGDELRDVCRKNQPQVLLDMKHVPLLDSYGLEFLLNCRDSAIRNGGTFKLVGLNNLCQEIFRVTGVDAEFDVYENAVKGTGSFVS